MRRKVIAIVGAGASGGAALSGVAQAAKTFEKERSLEVVVFEPSAKLFRGRAYSTRNKKHLMNMPVRTIRTEYSGGTLFDFSKERKERGEEIPDDHFIRREMTGDWLELTYSTVMEDAERSGLRIDLHQKRVVDVVPDGDRLLLETEDGSNIHTDRLLATVGNIDSDRYRGFAKHPRFAVAQVDGHIIQGLPSSGRIAILGIRLSAKDAYDDARASGHTGSIDFLGPSGKLPDVRPPYDPDLVLPLDPLEAVRSRPQGQRLGMLLEAYRKNRVELGLRSSSDDLFSNGHEPGLSRLSRQIDESSSRSLRFSMIHAFDRRFGQIWQLLDEAEKKQFERYLASRYARAAFPMNISNALDIQESLIDGKLEVQSIDGDLIPTVDGFRCQLKSGETRSYDFVLDATGASLAVKNSPSAFIRNMYRRGLIEEHPSGGVDVDARTGLVRRRGFIDPRIAFAGTLTKGVHFEVNSVEHNTVMASRAARELVRCLSIQRHHCWPNSDIVRMRCAITNDAPLKRSEMPILNFTQGGE